MRRVSARVDLRSTEEGMGSRLVFTRAGSSREKRVRGGERNRRARPGGGARPGSETPRLRSSLGSRSSRRLSTTGVGGEEGRFAAPTRWLSDGWEGWVPAPRLHGGRISIREDNGGVVRDGRFANKPLPDGCQTGGRDGSPPPVFTGAGSRREDNGGRGVRVGGWG